MSPSVHLMVPGPLDQRTGGYLYDARMARGLEARGWAVRVHELPGRFPEADTRGREALAGALEEVPDDSLVVLDGLAAGLLPEVVAPAARRLRIVALVHHPLADETGLDSETARRFREREHRTLEACRGVMVTSPFTARELSGYGVPADTIRTVVPGTEPAPPARGPASPEAPPELVSVGSVTPRKGHDVLVEALLRLGDTPWTLTVAGSLTRAPDFAARVQGRVEEAGLAPRVRFMGELDGASLEDVWAGASLFVLPSWHEGYGMALTEALARGLPVVSTTGGAVPHTVPEEAGILVPPGDAEALARALESLLTDGARRRKLAEAAREHAERLPDWEEAVDRFGAALLELADGPAA